MDATPDELLKPLGTGGEPQKETSRIPIRAIMIGAGLLLMLALAVGTAFFMALPTSVVEPFAAAPIKVREVDASVFSPSPPPPTIQSVTKETVPGSEDATAHPSTESFPDAVLIRVPDASAKLSAAPDLRLVEYTQYGLLPKIGADGARASEIYGRQVALKQGPHIALVLRELGTDQSATAKAITRLPSAVTLAFSPSGSDLDQNVAKARDHGHEVMLQVFVEPRDPGHDPHVLIGRAKPHENIERLHRAMGRFTGYTGIIASLGETFAANKAALAPILEEITGRGLIIVEDESSSQAPPSGQAMLKAQTVIDAVPNADAIDRELQRLEELAREHGAAIGSASARPLTIDHIARWAETLEKRGIQLVPVSALAVSHR